MNRIVVPLVLVIVCSGAAWLPTLTTIPANRVQAQEHTHHHDPGDNACAKVCSECAIACSSCFLHCTSLLQEGQREHAVTLSLCNDCADLCSLAANVEGRNGPLRNVICDACATACDQCAAECERFADQPHMVACARACQACAAACRDSISRGGHGR